MKLVIIESPFAPQTPRPNGSCNGCGIAPHYRHCAYCRALEQWHSDRAANIQYARAAIADSLRRGEAPFASHALYTQRGILDDNQPADRALGIAAGFAWGAKADLVAVYTDRGISQGMREGMARAEIAGQPIEQRTLYKPDPDPDQDTVREFD